MRLGRITLQDFRNVSAADLSLEGRQHFLLGPNGQGKTNLLEAAGFVTALRSFRTTDPRVLIQQGRPEAAVACAFEHEHLGPTRLVITLRPGAKDVHCDGERVTRLADHLGRFPTVVFSSQDHQLIRGAPGLRRRWLDLTLAAVSPAYLAALQTYHRALTGRNQLLKRLAPVAELAAFEHPLATAAATLATHRTAGLVALFTHVAEAYAQIADHAEPAAIRLAPAASASSVPDASGWLALFAQNRPRDLQFRTTLVGPHRDELVFTVNQRPARDYGSEGQQRSLVIALRLAQVAFFRARMQIEPVLLADDVLGELDPGRRRRFWASLGQTRQIIATGTTLPDAELGAWQVFHVAAGAFTPAP